MQFLTWPGSPGQGTRGCLATDRLLSNPVFLRLTTKAPGEQPTGQTRLSAQRPLPRVGEKRATVGAATGQHLATRSAAMVVRRLAEPRLVQLEPRLTRTANTRTALLRKGALQKPTRTRVNRLAFVSLWTGKGTTRLTHRDRSRSFRRLPYKQSLNNRTRHRPGPSTRQCGCDGTREKRL